VRGDEGGYIDECRPSILPQTRKHFGPRYIYAHNPHRRLITSRSSSSTPNSISAIPLHHPIKSRTTRIQDERSTSRSRSTQPPTDRSNEGSRSQNNVRGRFRNGIRTFHTRVRFACTDDCTRLTKDMCSI